ncbi:MAG TPA: phasin family protein [Xanthobacteraceae bacterium]|nr:phasin family protein [Xanthobacteraceae bacterium]
MSKKREPWPLLTAEFYEAADTALDDADNFYSNWLDAGRQQLLLLENHLDAVRAGLDAVAKKMIALSASNFSSASKFVRKLMLAKDAGEISRLHLEFYQKQSAAFTAQLQDLGKTMIEAGERAA